MRTKETMEITRLIFSCLQVAMVIFLLNCCDVGSLDFSGMDTTLPTPDLPVLPIDEAPQLISPENGAVLDNGRTDQSDVIIWDFDWSDVTNATSYHIYVIHQGAQYPAINDTVHTSSYHSIKKAYIANENRHDWTWKVRGCRLGNGGSLVYGPWSEERTFVVEPVNTDPLSSR